VEASRSLRSSSASCGTWILNGVTSFVAVGSTSCAVFMAVPCAVNDPRLAGNIPAARVAAAAPKKLRREMAGGVTPVLFTELFFMSRSRNAYHALNLLLRPTVRIAPRILIRSLRRLAKLEHQDGASLGHAGLRPLNL